MMTAVLFVCCIIFQIAALALVGVFSGFDIEVARDPSHKAHAAMRATLISLILFALASFVCTLTLAIQ